METQLCECCDERPVWDTAVEHGFPYCEECAENTICDVCGCECAEYTNPRYHWEDVLCDDCQAARARRDWVEQTCEHVQELAQQHGWESRLASIAATGTHYYELTRDDGDEGVEVVKVRVSDHGSAYCSEDISLAFRPSGDDHDLETLVARLSE